MAKRNQTEEMSRAADRFAEAAKELSSALNRFMDFQEKSVERYEAYQRSSLSKEPISRSYPDRERVGVAVLGLLGTGGLSEDEAGVLAEDEVHHVRNEFIVIPGQIAQPDPEELHHWEYRREERRRLEGND